MKDWEGHFDRLDEEAKELVMKAVAEFHYRNGVKHPDGSMGEISISPGQLNDVLAYFHRSVSEL
jgi:hypothetical protein